MKTNIKDQRKDDDVLIRFLLGSMKCLHLLVIVTLTASLYESYYNLVLLRANISNFNWS